MTTNNARAIGTATIAFGLVSIPVKIYSTKGSSDDADKLSFRMLHDADGARLKQQYVCTSCNEVVDREHTVKGYEHAKGQHVIFTVDELDALDAVATNVLAIDAYIPAREVDPLWVDATYYLGPDKGAERAYRVLSDALRGTGHVGIGAYSAKGRQHIVCVRPCGNGLLYHELRYEHEVKDFDAVPLGDAARGEYKPAELRLAKLLIEKHADTKLRLDQYTDQVHERTLKLIEAKIEGGEIKAEPAPSMGGGIVDLFEALKASLDLAPPPAASRKVKAPRGRAVAAKSERATAARRS